MKGRTLRFELFGHLRSRNWLVFLKVYYNHFELEKRRHDDTYTSFDFIVAQLMLTYIFITKPSFGSVKFLPGKFQENTT